MEIDYKTHKVSITDEDRMNRMSLFYAKLFSCIVPLYFFVILYFPLYIHYATVAIIVFEIIYILFQKKLSYNNNSILWLLFIIVSFFGMFLSDSISLNQWRYFITLVNMYFFYSIFISFKVNYEIVVKYLNKGFFYVSTFFLIGSTMQLISPDLLVSINNTHIPNTLASINFINRGLLVGFTSQTGVNGFLLSVSLAYFIILFFTNKKKSRKILLITLIIFTFYLITLTGKRIFILLNILILIFLLPFLTKHKILSPIIAATITVIIYYFLSNTEAGIFILSKMSSDDITNGRIDLYIEMWGDILKKPLIGNGTNTTRSSSIYQMDGHNIYLQVLRENGLIGFILFTTFIVRNLYNNFKKIISWTKKNTSYYNLLLSLYFQLLFLLWGLTGNPLYDIFALQVYFIAVATSTVITNRNTINKEIL